MGILTKRISIIVGCLIIFGLIVLVYCFISYVNVYQPEENTIGNWLEKNVMLFLEDKEQQIILQTEKYDGNPWDAVMYCGQYADESYYAKYLPHSSFPLRKYLTSLTINGDGPYMVVIRGNNITYCQETVGPRWMFEENFFLTKDHNYSIIFNKSLSDGIDVLKVVFSKNP